MTKEKLLEKLESLFEFNHKSKTFMYSHDLVVISSNSFFCFCDTDNCIRVCIPYSDILDISLEEDLNEQFYLSIKLINGDFQIPASGFDIKSGATIHSIEMDRALKRAWIVQELKENQVLVVFATCKKEAIFIALSIFGFDVNDIIDNCIPYTIDTLPALDEYGDVLSDKNYLDPGNEEDWQILKQYSFYYDDEDHIRYSFQD